MSFFALSTGEFATGLAQDAFVPDMSIIPNNTRALAHIEEVDTKTFNGQTHYQVTWKLASKPFKNRIVRQKVDVFNQEPAKSDRAKQMLMLIFKTCGVQLSDMSMAPKKHELYQLKDKLCGILVREWEITKDDGTKSNGNWVAEVHPAAGFEEEIGIKMESSKPKKQSVHNELNPPPFEDDAIPF